MQKASIIGLCSQDETENLELDKLRAPCNRSWTEVIKAESQVSQIGQIDVNISSVHTSIFLVFFSNPPFEHAADVPNIYNKKNK